jgi:hypothetical protein
VIVFVAPADETWEMEEYLAQHGGRLSERMRILTYDEIAARRQLPLGTYIFAALDQLTPTETEIAAQCWNELSAASPGVTLLNHPLEAMRRYELLKTCFELKRNSFRVGRATDFHRWRHFPAFIRSEVEHGGSVTPVVLHGRWQMALTLAKASLHGFRLRDLIIVEYCHTADPSGVFRLHCATIVGDSILPQVMVHNRNWITKWTGRLVDAEKAAEQSAFVERNPHAEWLSETFSLAKIGYGRIDYGLRGNAPQVWEINTNPTIVRRAGLPRTMSQEQQELLAPVRERFLQQLGAALERIDSGADPHRTVRIHLSRVQLQRLTAENRLRRRLRARKTALGHLGRPAVRLLRRLLVAGGWRS